MRKATKMEYRFSLDNSRSARLFSCPSCGKRTFKRYKDKETGHYLPQHVGRCNREVNCQYHYTPKNYFVDNQIEQFPKSGAHPLRTLSCEQIAQKPSLINQEFFEKSLNPTHFENNYFIQYLKRVLGSKWADVAERFKIGCATRWPGATVFWQIDAKGRIRSGKVMLYDPLTGKRVKGHIDWVHSILLRKGIITNFYLTQSLFGEHQLIDGPHRPVAIVESEKTAVVASAYLPEFTWMACGSLNGISSDKLAAIQKNKIALYPDINSYEKWNEKAAQLRNDGFLVTVSDLLERADFVTAQERNEGYDLADYLPQLRPFND